MNDSNGQVVFYVPDFTSEDGTVFSDIEVIVEMEGGIRDAARIVETLDRPLNKIHQQAVPFSRNK